MNIGVATTIKSLVSANTNAGTSLGQIGMSLGLRQCLMEPSSGTACLEKIKRAADKLVAAARSALATHGVNLPQIPTQLGCGGYGCVYATDDPNVVVKVTHDATEAHNAEAIRRGIVKSRALPSVSLVRRWHPTARWYFVVREALDDVSSRVRFDWDDCGYTEPCAHLERLRDRCRDTCAPVRVFVKHVRALCEQNVKLNDVVSRNLGVRAETDEIVIRDLGRSKLSGKQTLVCLNEGKQ